MSPAGLEIPRFFYGSDRMDFHGNRFCQGRGPGDSQSQLDQGQANLRDPAMLDPAYSGEMSGTTAGFPGVIV